MSANTYCLPYQRYTNILRLAYFNILYVKSGAATAPVIRKDTMKKSNTRQLGGS